MMPTTYTPDSSLDLFKSSLETEEKRAKQIRRVKILLTLGMLSVGALATMKFAPEVIEDIKEAIGMGPDGPEWSGGGNNPGGGSGGGSSGFG